MVIKWLISRFYTKTMYNYIDIFKTRSDIFSTVYKDKLNKVLYHLDKHLGVFKYEYAPMF